MDTTLHLRFRVLFPDWVGVVAKVVGILAENGLSVASMEMGQQDGNAVVHVEGA